MVTSMAWLESCQIVQLQKGSTVPGCRSINIDSSSDSALIDVTQCWSDCPARGSIDGLACGPERVAAPRLNCARMLITQCSTFFGISADGRHDDGLVLQDPDFTAER